MQGRGPGHGGCLYFGPWRVLYRSGQVNPLQRLLSEAANLYILVAADSGTGKSHTQSFVFKELAHMEAVQKARYREERQQYEEDMLAFRKSKTAKPTRRGEAPQCSEKKEMPKPKRPPNIQYMLDDSTLEAAVELLSDNPRGLVWLVDEFYGFFQGLDRYSANKNGGPSEGKRKLLSAWDGRTISMSRKSKDGLSNELYVERATLSICGCIQPNLLPNIFSHNDEINGTPQRFLFLRCPPQKFLPWPPPKISDETIDLVRSLTRGMLGLAMAEDPDGRLVGLDVDMTPEAQKAFELFRNTMFEKVSGTGMAAFAAKIAGSAMRIALILHYMRHVCEGNFCDGEVTFEDMSNAVKLADFFYAQAQNVKALIPDIDGKVKEEVSDFGRKVAHVLLMHESQIVESGERVRVNELKEWLKDEKVKYEDKDLWKALDTFRMQSGKSNGVRHRLCPASTLKLFRKLEKPVEGVFGGDEE